MLPRRSIRARLALSYAAIALLTGAVLGGILLSVLAGYFGRAEDAYLGAAARRLSRTAPRSADASGYADWVRFGALVTQTRVRLVAADGTLIADSGSPDSIDPRTLAGGRVAGVRPPPDAGLPGPLGSGLFGRPGGARSRREIRVSLTGVPIPPGSVVVLSEGPASGADVLRGVAEGWLVSASLAVAAAAFVGWVFSSRIAAPIGVLTEASDRMAEGDLGSRAHIRRDDEFGRLADSFNEMAERTQTTMTALRRFFGDAAHELGTPLTALRADLELARESEDASDARRLVERALGQAGRLERLSANLLRLSRIEAGEATRAPSVIDLREVARRAAATFASRADQAALSFCTRIASGPLPVLADSAQMLVLIENLLDNALKFTPAEGTVELGTRAEDSSALLWVRDSGVGIPADERSRVFERFHRAPNAARYQGSGLGLSIVKATVERFGGSVVLESGPEGTLVTVSLPLSEASHDIPAS